ncbi:hypothetical protein [Xinfangfangia pollutisoli]|uniref:hypothetical protein n=1 Tax=Xinfangfangia pollutisoli TaxID=2865960 RepID=UPI001CD2013C|nr:hypothetical protein [Xinfangfangia pollutisoli]
MASWVLGEPLISTSHRYVFVCEIGISTLYDRFPPPTARAVFQALAEKCKKGELPVKSTGLATGRIHDIRIDGDYVIILFRYSDPEISEGTAENIETRGLRRLELLEKEIHAVSAHMLIDLAEPHEATSAYPTIVENVDSVSRSLMMACLNTACRDFFTEKRRKPGAKVDQEYGVRLNLRGHQSSTIKSILSSGGVLLGVHLETASTKEDGFGEGKYPVVTKQQVEIQVQGRPTGEGAISWLKEKITSSRKEGLMSAKIVIEAEDRRKTEKLDLDLPDITDDFLIRQTRLDGFETLLRSCENEIRNDLVEKMKGAMPP